MLLGGPSYWFHAIGGLPKPRPPLPGSTDADVVIIGAGFTGLWTAYYLKRADPTLRIVILEREQAGYGASGRNGGWLCGDLAGHHDRLSKRAVYDTVAEVGRVIAAEAIACDYLPGGALSVATDRAQLTRLRRYFRELRANGDSDADSTWLEPDQLHARVRIAGVLGGIAHSHYARVQPAKLAVALAGVVEALGVTIYEKTPVREILPRLARADQGDVHARWVVRATEGYTASLRGYQRLLLPMRSCMIVTEPLGEDAWRELGWAGNEGVHDQPHLYVYLQRTADGRIAIGGRGNPYRFASRTDAHGEVEAPVVRQLTGRLHQLFPVTSGVRITHGWSGVLGVPRDWRMSVGVDPTAGLAWGGGFVGSGVAASNLAARTIRDLIRGEDTDLTRQPVAQHRWQRRWEPEPVRYLGAQALFSVFRAVDNHERRTGRPAFAPLVHLIERATGKDAF